jgi:hypothetical protein
VSFENLNGADTGTDFYGRGGVEGTFFDQSKVIVRTTDPSQVQLRLTGIPETCSVRPDSDSSKYFKFEDNSYSITNSGRMWVSTKISLWEAFQANFGAGPIAEGKKHTFPTDDCLSTLEVRFGNEVRMTQTLYLRSLSDFYILPMYYPSP